MSTVVNQGLPGQEPGNATLRHQLLKSLLTPIILVFLVSSVVSYNFAINYAALAYDNALFDSVLDITRQLRFTNGVLRVDLPRAALDMLESDKDDRVYYSVNDAAGTFVAGHAGLPLPPDESAPGKPLFYDISYNGSPVRVAALRTAVPGTSAQEPILIQVAETLNKRRILAGEILLGMLLPELLLILAVGVVVWFGIERGLRPLSALQNEIGSRSHRDLSPLPERSAPAEVRSLVHAMNDLLARLSAALSSQRRFIADAAHQLRTPLAGLKTQSELALRQKDTDEMRSTLHQLNAATGQTTHLVNQLLTLARAEPGAYRVHDRQWVDLNELLRVTTSEWVPRAIERDIDLGFENAPHAANIEGDAFLLREMLNNLIENAIRYTQRGGEITVSVLLQNDEVQVSVEDNGPGIPATERERVFERFHRVLGSGAEGCGLGLAIVREIAQTHSGDARLEAGADGHGTVVSVTFPKAQRKSGTP